MSFNELNAVEYFIIQKIPAILRDTPDSDQPCLAPPKN